MTTALQIPALAKLHQSGFNPLVLRTIEDNAVMQAVEMRMSKGIFAHPGDELMRFAASLLPQGVSLHQLYAETKSAMRDHPIEELQLFSDHLERVASDLEFSATRLMADNQAAGATVGQFAAAQHTLAERYADIIDAANTLQSQAGMQPIHMLAPITERPNGALEPFYDKALALLAQRAAQHRDGTRAGDSAH